MDKWNSPGNNNILYLPIVDSSFNMNNLTMASSGLSVSVEDGFCSVWEEGPLNESVEELTRCMTVIGNVLCELIKVGQGKVHVHTKANPNDLVTEMDFGIECLLRKWINRFYPSHKIIGEEGPKETLHTKDYVWYLDPVDGTTNFINGGKEVALHIGCLYNGLPYFSYVGMPIQDRYCVANHKQYFYPKLRLKENPSPLVIGTEYLDYRQNEHDAFHALLQDLNASPYRCKSIGVNIMSILTEKASQ